MRRRVRQEHEGQLRYLDIQIKPRSSGAQHAGTFAALTIRNPRPDFWFIFYSETLNTYWIMPFLEVVRLANQTKGGSAFSA